MGHGATEQGSAFCNYSMHLKMGQKWSLRQNALPVHFQTPTRARSRHQWPPLLRRPIIRGPSLLSQILQHVLKEFVLFLMRFSSIPIIRLKNTNARYGNASLQPNKPIPRSMTPSDFKKVIQRMHSPSHGTAPGG